MSCEMFFAWLTTATVLGVPTFVGWLIVSTVRHERRRHTRPG